MARPAVRTHQLPAEVIADLGALFGTLKRAFQALDLSPMDFHTFRRAMAHETVAEADAQAVQSRWALWRATFLRPDAAAPFNLDAGNPYV